MGQVMGQAQALKTEILETIENDFHEAFAVIEGGAEDLGIGSDVVATAKAIAVDTYRLYTQVAADVENGILPTWPTAMGHTIAMTTARFAAYAYLYVEADAHNGAEGDYTLETLLADAGTVLEDALSEGVGEEE